jgi:hypothetical protein
VLTSQYGNLRQSWNGNETVLTTSNVANLTQLATLAVDNPGVGQGLGSYNPIYAQPLYVAGITVHSAYQSNCSNLTVNNQPACNMLIAVTGYGSIWAWNADTGTTIFSRTALYGDCGQGGGVAVPLDGGAGTAAFGGILSTPVIDPTLSPPAMFLTSLCVNSGNTAQWWLHEIDLTNALQDVANSNSPVFLTGTSPALDNADNEVGTSVAFAAYEASQRSALLEVRNSYATPNPVIYFTFGSGVSENYNAQGQPTKYHGWIFAYTVTGANNQLAMVAGYPFATTIAGAAGNNDTPLCAQDCQYANTNPQGLNYNCVPQGYQNSPNWCGHGGGVWMSSRGPAANTLGTGSSQVAISYFGSGNGGFQTNGQNLSQSLFDFRLSQATGADSVPYQTYTPHGGPQGCGPTGTQCQPALQPAMGGVCPNEPNSVCQYTVETTNENDWDMATGGILLFNDLDGNPRLVTVDKAGYGHLLPQGQLCAQGDCPQEFVQGDTGDWVFGALASNFCDTLGVNEASNCHRITSMAFYNNTLYFWPYQEELIALQLALLSTQSQGAGTVSTSTSGSVVSANGSNGTNFTSTVIPGDFLIINGCTPSLNYSQNTCPVITSVQSDTLLYLSFDPHVTTPMSWYYSGYFVKPEYETHPVSDKVYYPGGSVMVTSNGTVSGSAIVWGLVSVNTNCYQEGAGALNAYNASTLGYLWSSNALSTPPLFSLTYPAFNATAGYAGGLYALPVIVNGNAYVPTFGVNSGTCTSPQTSSGIIVFCGPGTRACTGSWQ